MSLTAAQNRFTGFWLQLFLRLGLFFAVENAQTVKKHVTAETEDGRFGRIQADGQRRPVWAAPSPFLRAGRQRKDDNPMIIVLKPGTSQKQVEDFPPI